MLFKQQLCNSACAAFFLPLLSAGTNSHANIGWTGQAWIGTNQSRGTEPNTGQIRSVKSFHQLPRRS
ncbi:unnamed protein product [Sphenostylis stenocarpa]|uniref:Secreted protein n=1 Tax=Sphenostylis stenocarpa TaxID=92480 RepID=A0AA86VD63_9FABA|nr:unnamed protein product [Sphenostylis stenocarpa]